RDISWRSSARRSRRESLVSWQLSPRGGRHGGFGDLLRVRVRIGPRAQQAVLRRNPGLDAGHRRARRRRLRLRQWLPRHPRRRPPRRGTVLCWRHAGGGPGRRRGRRARAPPEAGRRGEWPRRSALGRTQLLLRRPGRLPLVLRTAEARGTGGLTGGFLALAVDLLVHHDVGT